MARKIPTIQAELRERIGSRYADRARRAGKLPAVIYGHKQAPTHITVDPEQLLTHLHEGAHVIEIKIGAVTENCLVRDLQWDYLGTDVIHVDMARVDLAEEVSLTVALTVRGQLDCPGLKTAGAFLEEDMTELPIRCLVADIPDSIVADISALEVGQALHAGDIALPQGVKLDCKPELLVASIHLAKAMEEPVVEPGAVVAPEVLTEKKAAEGEEKKDDKKK